MAELAGLQYGIVARQQLVALGYGASGIEYGLASGRLHRVHRGVYSVGHRLLSIKGGWMAAVLAGGEGAVLSHRSAAALWDLIADRGPPAITVEARGRCRRRGLVVHTTERLPGDERAVRERIPVTSLARTLLDLAEAVDAHMLRRAFEQAERRGVLDMRVLRRTCRRHHGRRGLKPMLALLGDCARPIPDDVRSEHEAAFFDLVYEAGLPVPATNVLVEGYLVDAWWPAERLVVEVDSVEFHSSPADRARDAKRDAALIAAGHKVLRVPEERIHSRPGAVVAELRTVLLGRGRGFR